MRLCSSSDSQAFFRRKASRDLRSASTLSRVLASAFSHTKSLRLLSESFIFTIVAHGEVVNGSP
jgi:hypothetical protein